MRILNIILAIVVALIAFLAGVAAAYSLLEKRLNTQEERHLHRLRKEIEAVERQAADRMQNRLDALTAQYETKIQQLETQLQNQASSVESTPTPILPEPIAPEGIPPEPSQVDPTPHRSSPASEPSEPELPEPVTLESETPHLEASESEAPDIEVLESEVREPVILEPETPNIEVLASETPEPETPSLSTSTNPDLKIPDPSSDLPVSSSLNAFTLTDLTQLRHSQNTDLRQTIAEQILEVLQNQQPLNLPLLTLVKTLRTLSQDANPHIRCLGIASLGHLRHPQVPIILRQALRDASPDVVKAAVQALGPWYGKPKAPRPTPAPKTRRKHQKKH